MSDTTASPATPKSSSLTLSDKLYNVMKFVALVALPGVGTAYFSLASVWGLPDAGQVVGTITIVDTFLGLVLHVSTASYNASDAKYIGEMEVHEPGDGQSPVIYGLNLNTHPETFKDKKDITFKVVKKDISSTPGDVPPVPPVPPSV